MLEIHVHFIHLLHFGDQSLENLFIDGDNRLNVIPISVGNKLVHLVEVSRLLKLTCLLLGCFSNYTRAKNGSKFLLIVVLLLDNSWWGRLWCVPTSTSGPSTSELAQTEVVNHLVRDCCSIIRRLNVFLAFFIWCKISILTLHTFYVYLLSVISDWGGVQRLFVNQLFFILEIKNTRSLSLFLNWTDSIVDFNLSSCAFDKILEIVLIIFVLRKSWRSALISTSSWLSSKLFPIVTDIIFQIISLLWFVSYGTSFLRAFIRNFKGQSTLIFKNGRLWSRLNVTQRVISLHLIWLKYFNRVWLDLLVHKELVIFGSCENWRSVLNRKLTFLFGLSSVDHTCVKSQCVLLTGH